MVSIVICSITILKHEPHHHIQLFNHECSGSRIVTHSHQYVVADDPLMGP